MKKFLALMVIAAMTLFSVSAFAYDVKVDDDTFAKVGAKAQIRYTMTNPDPNHDRVDASAFQGRLFVAGQVTNVVKFGLNLDMGRGRTTSTTWFPTSAANESYPAGSPTSTFSLSDALITLDIAKELKINTGIYRMAVSRKALQDTYQVMFVNQPEVAGSSYLSSATRGSAALAGYRGAGITLWGDMLDGKLRYNVGFWDGDYAPVFTDADPYATGFQAWGTNPNDEIGMSARLVFNFLDPEKGYTCPGCWLGKAKVANIGVGYYTQDYVVPVTFADATYTITTVDAFYDADNATAEAGYLMYDNDQGYKPKGWYIEAGYAIDKIQPAVRYESWDDDGAATDWTKYAVDLNYLISGHDAKIQLEYASKDYDDNSALGANGPDVDTLTLQLQVQF